MSLTDETSFMKIPYQDAMPEFEAQRFHEGVDSSQIQGHHKLKARIEIICDYKELHTIDEFIKQCQRTNSEGTENLISQNVSSRGKSSARCHSCCEDH